MSYRSVLNVSNGGPSNPKLTLKINSLRIKLKAQNFASWVLSEHAFKIFTASQIDQSEALSLFQPTTNNERAWSRLPQSSSRRLLCAKEKSSGVENENVPKAFHCVSQSIC